MKKVMPTFQNLWGFLWCPVPGPFSKQLSCAYDGSFQLKNIVIPFKKSPHRPSKYQKLANG